MKTSPLSWRAVNASAAAWKGPGNGQLDVSMSLNSTKKTVSLRLLMRMNICQMTSRWTSRIGKNL